MAYSTFTVTLFLLSNILFPGVQTVPLSLRTRDSVTAFATLSQPQIFAFRSFTHYASTAYCLPSQTRNWTCGAQSSIGRRVYVANCDANPTFQPVASGGDGDDVQFWFVGVDPTLKTIVVSHQGTDPSKLMPLLTDVDLVRGELDSTLFPGVDDSIKVHDGFKNSQAETSRDVLAAVKTAMVQSGLHDVTVVGHSLGAAIALIDGVFLPLHIPDVNVKVIGYGMPRVGNKFFAKFVDANVNVTRITHKDDVVPILPGRLLGFRHPSGEKHIQHDDLTWIACPGQDNTDVRCSTGDVKTIFGGSIADHSGPYDTVTMSC